MYDPEDNLNCYRSPVQQQSDDQGEMYRDLAEQVAASHPSRTQVSCETYFYSLGLFA